MNRLTIPTITPSNLIEIECPKRFAMRLFRKWPKTERSFNHGAEFGVALHRMLAKTFSPGNVHCGEPQLVFLDSWAKSEFYKIRYPNPRLRDADIMRAVSCVRSYVEHDEDAEFTVATELTGSFPIMVDGEILLNLSARLDRLIIRTDEPGVLVVRDYKTSKPKIDMLEAFVLMYVAKLLRPSMPRLQLEYDFIYPDGRLTREVFYSSEFKGFAPILVEKVRQVMSDPSFPAVENSGCTWCPLRQDCFPRRAPVEMNPQDPFG